MAQYFLDTSALIKRYHQEVGSSFLDHLFTLPEKVLHVSDLTIIELHSAAAKKVRVGEMNRQEFNSLLEQLNNDIASGLLEAIPLTDNHKYTAIALLDKHALTRALRTLDALQLAVAVDLKERGELTYFVTADERFSKIVEEEGIAVLNPEGETEAETRLRRQ